jgi:hypothetical protein
MSVLGTIWQRGSAGTQARRRRGDKPLHHCRKAHLRLENLEDRLTPSTIAVTQAGDGAPAVGFNTLRSAIAVANANPGSTIVFAIDDTVLLTTPLTITAPTTINASFHTVTVDGGGSPVGVRDFVITSGINVNFIGDTTGKVFAIQNGFVSGGNGAGIWASSPAAAVSLYNLKLLSNVASNGGVAGLGNGAGVYSAGSLGIHNSVVDGNKADGNGGGAYAGRQLVVDSSTLTDNIALNGAGVFEAGTSPVVITGTTSFTAFRHNNTTLNGGGSGGAVWAKYDVTAGFSIFDQNTGSANGGAIFSSLGNVTLNSGTSITNNAATNGVGGGVYAFRNIIASGVVVADNSAASLGGGLASVKGHVTVGLASLIGYAGHGNSAGTFGGGIYSGGDVFVGGNSVVEGNTAGLDGGGIWAAGNVTIDPSYIALNIAQGNGGGIATGQSPSSTVLIQSSFVYQNMAAGNGGGAYSPAGTIDTQDTAIFSNRAGGAGGGLFDGSGSVQLFQPTIIDSNVAGAGAGVYVGSGAVLQTGSVFSSPDMPLPMQPPGSGLAFYTMQLTNFPHTIIISFNQSTSGGGGIDAESSEGVTLVNTWVTNNTASTTNGLGGGMLARNVLDVSISYSTFSANLSKSAQGGGLAVVAIGSSVGQDSVSVDDSTFGAWQGINNSATFGAGVYLAGVDGYFNHVTFNDNHLNTTIGSGAAIYADALASAFIENLLADDTNSVAGGSLLGFAPTGSITSMGHNLSSDASLATVFNYSPVNGDISGGFQGLTPLGFHGGATPTYNLLAGGQAINGGDAIGPVLDQNGVVRPLFGLPSDIGAVQH